MNKILNITLFALLALLVTACGAENEFEPKEGEGQLSIRKMMLDIENEAVVTKAPAINIDDFMVDIYKGEVLYRSYLYKEMPEIVTLPVGKFTVKVKSGELQDAAFDAPYYVGEQDFEIIAKQVTEVETVKCKLANVKVTVIFSDELKQHMSDDAKVVVVVADNEVLEFTKDHDKDQAGYFRYVEGSKTLVATFFGLVDDSDVPEQFNTKIDVAPGTHYRFTYTYHNGNTPTGEGNIDGSGIHVRSEVEDVTHDLNLTPEEDRPTGDDRPNEDNPDDPGNTDNPDDPDTPDTPQAPTVESAVPYINLDGENPWENITGDVVLSMHSDAENGIEHLTVEIIGTLAEDLEGMLPTTFDLTNVDEKSATALKNFGFPVGSDVLGQKDLSFTIGQSLIGLMSSFEGKQEFKLTVQDANGTTVKSLIIIVPAS